MQFSRRCQLLFPLERDDLFLQSIVIISAANPGPAGARIEVKQFAVFCLPALRPGAFDRPRHRDGLKIVEHNETSTLDFSHQRNLDIPVGTQRRREHGTQRRREHAPAVARVRASGRSDRKKPSMPEKAEAVLHQHTGPRWLRACPALMDPLGWKVLAKVVIRLRVFIAGPPNEVAFRARVRILEQEIAAQSLPLRFAKQNESKRTSVGARFLKGSPHDTIRQI